MRAAIYNPYLDSLGGGERYTMAFVDVLVKQGYVVDVEWRDMEIREKLEKRFGKNFSKVNFVTDIKRGDGYDLCFWVSDGSIPTLRARRNFLHFQVPFHHVGGVSLLNKMKLFRIEKIICNSNFTKNVIDQEYGVEGIVIYPPVDVVKFKPRRKENIIFSMGRFSELKQLKHQDVLVQAFKLLVDEGLADWKLVLAGGSEVGATELVRRLKKASGGYPIEIVESPSFDYVVDLYGKSRIFWTASGYGENEEKNPEKVEHFGISVIEAMAGGEICLAYNAGGYKETVEDGVNGYLWGDIPELLKKTKTVLKSPKGTRQIVKKAVEDSKLYSEERFEKEVKELL